MANTALQTKPANTAKSKPKSQIKAVILAAGESSRFRPISHDRHKSLTKIAGKELIKHTVESVLNEGIDEVIIIHSPDDYKHFQEALAEYKDKIKLVVQTKAEGMGNALKGAAHHIAGSQFFVLNPDKHDAGKYMRPMMEKSKKEGADMVLLATKTAHPWRYGIARFDIKKHDRILAIHEKPEKGKEPSNMRIIGVYLLPKNFMEYYARVPEHHYAFEDALHLWMKENEAFVVNADKEPISCKYAFDLLDMAKDLTEVQKPYISKTAQIAKSATIEGNVHIGDGTKVMENAVIKGPVYIGKNCLIGNNALVRTNAVLEDGVQVGMNTEVARSVIMDNTHIHSGFIGDSVIGKGCHIGANFVTANRRIDRDNIEFTIKNDRVNSKKTSLGAVIGHETHTGVNVSTMPGSIIGYGCVIGPGSQVKGTIDSHILMYLEGNHVQKKRTITGEEIPVVFNVYDFRGKYPDELNDEFAERLGKAVGIYLKNQGTVVVGNDTREASEKLKRALIKGLIESNINVIDAGLGTTDKTALSTNRHKATLGIMVTGSHNAWKESGFKFLYQSGHGFSIEDMKKIKEFYLKNETGFGIGKFEERMEETNDLYAREIISAFKKYAGAKTRINSTIVVDCSNGGASLLLPRIFKSLGAKVIEVNCGTKVDKNIEPEPNEENRKYLLKYLKDNKADLALGTDADGDRIYVYDKNGRWLTGDELFAALLKITKAKKVVASIDTSKKVLQSSAAKFEITKVGDIHLTELGIKIKADLLGEPNGHFCFPKFVWYNSGMLAALILASSVKELPKIIKGLPDYHTQKKSYMMTDNSVKEEKMKHIMGVVDKKYKVISNLDGVKFIYKTSEVLIRASMTEPKIRMTVENKGELFAEKHFRELQKEFFSLGYMSKLNEE